MKATIHDFPMSEEVLQSNVVELARYLRWICYHTYDSRRSAPGFPDLFMCRGNRAIAAELKSAKGKVTPEQQKWLDELGQVPGITSMVLRPKDWVSGRVQEILA